MVGLIAGISGCATSGPAYVPSPAAPAPYTPPVQVSRPPPTSRPQHTTASWYGSAFKGRVTSSGERFDPNAMTAASKTLPLGSHVVVTNPQNGKSVTVRINDRGPLRRGRNLDLSKAAAQKLGITKKGVSRVEVRRTRKPLREEPKSAPAPAVEAGAD